MLLRHTIARSVRKHKKKQTQLSLAGDSVVLDEFENDANDEAVNWFLRTAMSEQRDEANAMSTDEPARRLVVAVAHGLEQACPRPESVTAEVAQTVLDRVDDARARFPEGSAEFREAFQRSRGHITLQLLRLELPPLPTEHLLRDIRAASDTDAELNRVLNAATWAELVVDKNLRGPRQEQHAYGVLHHHITQWLNVEKQKMLKCWRSRLQEVVEEIASRVEEGGS